MPSLGEAYISVHADTAPFQRELQAQVTKSTNAIEKAQNTTTRQRANDPNVGPNAQVKAQEKAQAAISRLYTADNKNFFAAQSANVDAHARAQKAIAGLYAADAKNRSKIEQAAYEENVARDKAAFVARDAIRKKDVAENKAVVNSYLSGQREIQVAERAAYSEHSSRVRAAAAAEKELARAAKEADDAHRSLGDRLVGVSSALSRIGFTGQTRLITLGATFGFPLATLAAFTLAAAGAATAVTIFGIKSADAARSATLQFQSLGLTATEAKKQFADLQALSNKGLQIANLDQDASLLLQLGLNAQSVTKILTTLGDIFSANGDTGATLQKDIDDTAKKFATLVNTAKITPRTFQTAVASLGIGVTAQEAFDQVKKNLNLTTKGLDDIIAKGKLSGSTLAQAALQAATPGTAGSLDKAVATSPTQALEALKSKAQTALADAFSHSGTSIAGLIGQLSTQLDGFIAKFSPKVIKLFTDVIPGLISALKPFGDALVSSLGLVEPLLKSIAPIISHLSADVSGFFRAANTEGSDTNKLLGGLRNVFHEILDVIHAATPAAESFAGGLGAILISLGALEPAFRAVANVIRAITSFPLAKFAISSAAVMILLNVAVKGLSVSFAYLAKTLAAAGVSLRLATTQLQATAVAAGEAGLAVDAAGAKISATKFAGLKGALGKALNAAPLLVIAYTAGQAIGEKLFGGIDQAAKQASNTFVVANVGLDHLQQSLLKAGISSVTTRDGIELLGESTLNASGTFAPFSTRIETVVNSMFDMGDTSNQVSGALQALGFNSQEAADIINGQSYDAAERKLDLLRIAALEAAGAVQQAAADEADIGLDNLARRLSGNKAPTSFSTSSGSGGGGGSTPNSGVGTGGSTGAAAAKAAADKIKAAFADLAGDLKAIADKTSEQTASQIKSEFKALIKDLEDSGNKSLVAGTKVIENKLLDRIKKLKPLQDKLAAELGIAQGVKDSAISSGSIDAGSGIATTFTGIQNKLRFGVATTQQFLTAIKKLQSEKLNRTSVKQLIDNFASDPAGALAAAQALVSAGQVGITGANGINDLQTQLEGLGNQLGNDTAGELYKQGQHIGDGLIEGLKSKVKEAEKVINDLADKMEKALKKKIKAHSPSEVFDDIAGDTIDGLTGGLDRRAHKVAAAAGRMGQTLITFGPGSVAVNNANPANPAGSGLMVGHGIVGVLERQKTQAVLMGVG